MLEAQSPHATQDPSRLKLLEKIAASAVAGIGHFNGNQKVPESAWKCQKTQVVRWIPKIFQFYNTSEMWKGDM